MCSLWSKSLEIFFIFIFLYLCWADMMIITWKPLNEVPFLLTLVVSLRQLVEIWFLIVFHIQIDQQKDKPNHRNSAPRFKNKFNDLRNLPDYFPQTVRLNSALFNFFHRQTDKPTHRNSSPEFKKNNTLQKLREGFKKER